MPEDNGKEATILYVDDTDAQRYAMSRVLRGGGFRVIEASTGSQALEMASQSTDLIVLDVNLPDINGLEVCQRIKASPETANTPVLQVSASLISTQARVAGLQGGADAYLIQPVDPEELIATVRALLRVRRAGRTSPQAGSGDRGHLPVGASGAGYARHEPQVRPNQPRACKSQWTSC
jgi:Response regulators consisting of a CheY-like receiver domain and a winged-helix DNA-binding domain